jgi:hypothetical protein
VGQKAGRVLKFFTDDSVAESEPFGEVRIKAFAVLDPARLNSVADYMATKARFDEAAFQWEHIDRAAPRFKRHLRPVLQSVEFAAPSTDDPLIEAVHFLKKSFPKGKPLGQYADTVFPTRCIPDKFKRSGSNASCLIGMNSSSTGSCAKVSKPAMFSAGTACASAASRMTWLIIASGRTKKD